jgi:hypothetical protein
MPIPMSVLVDDGWVPVSDQGKMINAKSFATGFEIRKGNQVLRTAIQNYSDTQQPAIYCFVTRIEYYDSGAQIPIELPQGLSEKSSIADFKKAYGEPSREEDGTNFIYYTWGSVFKEIVVVVRKETNQIIKIEVSCSPKNLD